MPQVTADQKKAFKREFMRLAKKWHMTEWAVEFIFDCDMEPQARIQHDWELCTATVEVNRENSGLRGWPESIARHEFMHMLTGKMTFMANQRYVLSRDIDDVSERLSLLAESGLSG